MEESLREGVGERLNDPSKGGRKIVVGQAAHSYLLLLLMTIFHLRKAVIIIWRRGEVRE